MPRHTVAAPGYLKRHGRPTHPMHLAQHRCFAYTYLSTPNVWHYTNSAGEQVSVRPAGQLRVNNGEALMPALLAGLGIADLPDFIVGDAIASGEVEVILKGWKQPEGAVHLVMPPGRPRPARVEALAEFLAGHLAKGGKSNGEPLSAARSALLALLSRFHILLSCVNLPEPHLVRRLDQLFADGNRTPALSRTRIWPMRTCRIVLSLAISVGGAATVHAQEYRGTLQQQLACTPDVFRLCGEQIPDANRIVACLRQNTPQLSETMPRGV